MSRVLTAIVAALLLLASVGPLPSGGTATMASAAAGKRTGLHIRWAGYDAATGTLTVDVRWSRKELRRPGDDAGHLTLLARGANGLLAVRHEALDLDRKHRSRHEIRLTAEEQATLDAAGAMLVAATHKHDDEDDGLYDRGWYDLASVGDAASPAPGSARGWASHRPCPGPFSAGEDLSSCMLVGADLASMYLTGANLTDANLSAADLSGATLSDSDLSESDLTRASLIGTTLTGADLTSATATFAGLAQANLAHAILTGADLTGANLYQASLLQANLATANLSRANLMVAALNGADLTNADLSGAILSNANLSFANLTGATLADAILTGALFCETAMPDGTINSANC